MLHRYFCAAVGFAVVVRPEAQAESGSIADDGIRRNYAPMPACRNQNTWPYLPTSVWNTPIGTGAQFVPANIFSKSSGELPDNSVFRGMCQTMILLNLNIIFIL